MKSDKFKVNGKSQKESVTTKDAKNAKPVITEAREGKPLSVIDQEVYDKTEEFHVFLTQRGLPYILVTQMPQSRDPIARFSFNHEHDKPKQTVDNAEWLFSHLGNMLNYVTKGFVRVVKQY